MPNDDPDSKVMFRVENDDGTIDVETLWAVSLGKDLYRLDNSPFYAYGVSWRDVVRAPFDPTEECPVFEALEEPGGHRTVRIILEPPAEEGNESMSILNSIVELGGTYEGANSSYLSIDIPADSDFWAICRFLTDSSIRWEHANPTYSELYPDDA